MTWATIYTRKRPRLESGLRGTAGRANGHARPGGAGQRRDTPYRVASTSASSYSTAVAGNTNRIYREER